MIKKSKRLSATIGFVVIAVAGVVSVARATTYISAGGAMCQAAVSGTLGTNATGITNSSASFPNEAICPLTLGTTTGNQSISAIAIGYSDGAAGTSSSFSCKVQKTAFGSLTVFTTVPKFTCGLAGGCPSNTDGGFFGIGFLSFNSSDLGPNLTTHRIDDNYIIDCSIAQTDFGHAQSAITTYYASF
jgi:phage-related tail fiber protein